MPNIRKKFNRKGNSDALGVDENGHRLMLLKKY